MTLCSRPTATVPVSPGWGGGLAFCNTSRGDRQTETTSETKDGDGLMTNQVESYKAAVKRGDEEAANKAYQAYKNSMEKAGQKPKPRHEL